MMHLESIPLTKYTAFARRHFKNAQKDVTPETVETIYPLFSSVCVYG
jgi:hypothetical protein